MFVCSRQRERGREGARKGGRITAHTQAHNWKIGSQEAHDRAKKRRKVPAQMLLLTMVKGDREKEGEGRVVQK